MYDWRNLLNKSITSHKTDKPTSSAALSQPVVGAGNNQYHILSTLDELSRYDILAIDTETDGLDQDCKLLGVSFCGEPYKAYWLPVDKFHSYDLWEVLKGKYLVMHNSKFDLDVLARHGCDLSDCQIFDTMIASYLLDENRSHKLKDLAESLLNEEGTRYEDISPQIDFSGGSVTMEKYACADADYTFKLYQIFKQQLEADGVDKLFYHIEMLLVPIILEMERTGIAIDTEKLKVLSDEHQAEQADLESRIFELAGGNFNLNSPQQLQAILFNDLKIPVSKKTKRGVPSTNNESLANIKDKHKIIPLILKWRELNKLLSTYITKLPICINTKTGRIHCSLNQIGTVTGRFSCSNPNLQNIPKDATIRSAFVPAPDHVFIDADFSQIELRVIAHYTSDPMLVKAYQSGLDVHKQTAASVLIKPIDEITKDERSFGKTLNFALCYGMGAETFSRRTRYPLDEAAKYREGFFQTYPKLKQALYDYAKQAEQSGYIQNMFGRRRRFKKDENTFMAFNSLIQSTAGDICKIAMGRLAKALPKEAKMLLQVHDELLFEVPAEMVESVKDTIVETMEILPKGIDGKEFTIPIKADAGIGENWESAKA